MTIRLRYEEKRVASFIKPVSLMCYQLKQGLEYHILFTSSTSFNHYNNNKNAYFSNLFINIVAFHSIFVTKFFMTPHISQKQHSLLFYATSILVQFFKKKKKKKLVLQYHRAADKQHHYLFQNGEPKPSQPRFLLPDPLPSYRSVWAAENSSRQITVSTKIPTWQGKKPNKTTHHQTTTTCVPKISETSLCY